MEWPSLWDFEKAVSKKSIRKFLLAAILMIAALMHFGLPRMDLERGATREQVSPRNPFEARLRLHYYGKTAVGEAYRYEVHVQEGFLPIQRILVGVSDCISQIEFVSASGMVLRHPQKLMCQGGRSPAVTLYPVFADKNYRIRFVGSTLNKDRNFRLQLFLGWPLNYLFCLLGGLIALTLFHFLRFEERYIRYTIPLGFYFYYLSFILLSFEKWTYDAKGHLDHVARVIQGDLIPKDICWECFQPPLAYWLAGLPYWATGGELLSTIAFSRAVSLAGFVLFLYFGFKYLQLYCLREKNRAILAVLIVFLPASLSHALRMGNESLFYAAFMAAIYYLDLAIRNRRLDLRALGNFAVATALALLTKATALVLYPISALLLFYSRRKIESGKKGWAKMARVLWPALVTFPIFWLIQAQKSSLINRLGALNARLKVGKEWWNVVGFDIENYFTMPFNNAWHDNSGRQYFLNYYLKSLGWGEFNWTWRSQYPALIWNGFWFLALITVMTWGTYSYYRGRPRDKLAVPIFLTLFCFFTSVAYRIRYPYAAMQDFRFLFPVIIPAGIVFLKLANAISVVWTRALGLCACIFLAILWLTIYQT